MDADHSMMTPRPPCFAAGIGTCLLYGNISYGDEMLQSNVGPFNTKTKQAYQPNNYYGF